MVDLNEEKRGRGRPPSMPTKPDPFAGDAPVIQQAEPRKLAFRPDGLPMGEVDPATIGPNGLPWGQRDPCDILSLDAATGYFEWDAELWPAWKAVARAELASDMLERSHILFRQKRDVDAMRTVGEKQWHVVSILSRLVKDYANGDNTQYADPRYDDRLIHHGSHRIPSRLGSSWRDFTKFPFRSGTGIRTLFNPPREEQVASWL